MENQPRAITGIERIISIGSFVHLIGGTREYTVTDLYVLTGFHEGGATYCTTVVQLDNHYVYSVCECRAV